MFLYTYKDNSRFKLLHTDKYFENKSPETKSNNSFECLTMWTSVLCFILCNVTKNPLMMAECQRCYLPKVETSMLSPPFYANSFCCWKCAVGIYNLSLCFTLLHFRFNLLVSFNSLGLVTRRVRSIQSILLFSCFSHSYLYNSKLEIVYLISFSL